MQAETDTHSKEEKLPSHMLEMIGATLEGAAGLIGFKDASHRYIFANQELETCFGAVAGSMIGLSDLDYLDAASARAIQASEAKVLANGTASRMMESLVIGDRTVNCATVRFPLRDKAGTIIGTGFVAIDLTGDCGNGFVQIADLEQAQLTIRKLHTALVEERAQAATDLLTGAYSRVRIEEAARHEIARQQRYGHPVSLMFAELDHFDRVQDSFGRSAGELVLKAVSEIARNCMRTTDQLGRWGGDAFVFLLPNSSGTSSRTLAERVRSAVAAHDFAGVGAMTVSLGIASCAPMESWEAWLKRAQMALSQAKLEGRNRVALAPVESERELSAGLVQIVWRKAYESGNAQIDAEHRFLFDASNSILDAIFSKQPQREIAALMQSLLAEVIQHFQHEEAVFRAVGFPEANSHQQIHEQLVMQAKQLIAKYPSGEVEVSAVFDFLAYEVIAQHFLAEDRKFFPYLATLA